MFHCSGTFNILKEEGLLQIKNAKTLKRLVQIILFRKQGGLKFDFRKGAKWATHSGGTATLSEKAK